MSNLTITASLYKSATCAFSIKHRQPEVHDFKRGGKRGKAFPTRVSAPFCACLLRTSKCTCRKVSLSDLAYYLSIESCLVNHLTHINFSYVWNLVANTGWCFDLNHVGCISGISKIVWHRAACLWLPPKTWKCCHHPCMLATTNSCHPTLIAILVCGYHMIKWQL